MDHESTPRGAFDEDDCTRVACAGSPPATPPLSPRQAFLAAHERLGNVAVAASGPALAVAAVDSRARVVDAFLVPDRSALILGRHTSCGLRLLHGSVSLRHLALLARHDGERTHAHVWDLSTGQPFVTEDGAETAALVADGPVYLAFGDYAVWIVPAKTQAGLPDRAKDAWETLPPRSFLDRRSPEKALPAQSALSSRSYEDFLEERTQVTAMAAPLLVGDGDEPEVGWGTLRFSTESSKARHRISAERLERGILVGRYDRCGLGVAHLDGMSRVHLLIVRIGDEVWAIDTASKNGVQRGGRSITAVALASQDQLVLAGTLKVDWTREIHAEA